MYYMFVTVFMTCDLWLVRQCLSSERVAPSLVLSVILRFKFYSDFDHLSIIIRRLYEMTPTRGM